METRSIAIGLVAIIAAFAAAFAISSSGGTKEETACAGVKAQSIKVAAPPAVAGVEVGGTLPSLRTERKAPAKKKKKASKKSTSTASSPSTSNASAPSTQNTTPSAPSTPSRPSTPSTPRPSAPKPSAPKPVQPISGGGEDG
jgi:hypothetical protein